MDSFRVESIRIKTTLEKVFQYVADPNNLPQWTHAFKAVVNGKAIMATPDGTMEVSLKVKASAPQGTIDWQITFPDGTVAGAFSRLVPDSAGYCIYSFVLEAPRVSLEQLEGTLSEQARILRQELKKLDTILSEP